MKKPEEWKKIEGLDGYEISNHGRVRSLDKWLINCLHKGRILKQQASKHSGHLAVRISVGSKKISLRINRIVASHFIGLIPDGSNVLHKNDIPADNYFENLYYGTQKQNMADRDRNGHTARGEKAGRAKLTTAKIRKIRNLHGKVSERKIARMFGVSHTNIQDIRKGKIWSHIDGGAPWH